MGVFVYEVDGLRAAAYGDVERSRVEEWAQQEEFKTDLNSRDYGGQPIWDEDAEVKIVEALPSEIDKWKESRERARQDGSIEPDDVEWLAFLIPTTHVIEENAA